MYYLCRPHKSSDGWELQHCRMVAGRDETNQSPPRPDTKILGTPPTLVQVGRKQCSWRPKDESIVASCDRSYCRVNRRENYTVLDCSLMSRSRDRLATLLQLEPDRRPGTIEAAAGFEQQNNDVIDHRSPGLGCGSPSHARALCRLLRSRPCAFHLQAAARAWHSSSAQVPQQSICRGLL